MLATLSKSSVFPAALVVTRSVSVVEDGLIDGDDTVAISGFTLRYAITLHDFTGVEIPKPDGYYGKVAQKIAAGRRHGKRKPVRCRDLFDAVIEGFEAGWLPERIAGRMRLEGLPRSVSRETIYSHVCSKDGRRENLARHLVGRRRERRPRHARKPRDTVFPLDRAIRNRPDEIAGHTTFGHREGASMILRREAGSTNVASLVERKTRFAVLLRNAAGMRIESRNH